MTALTWTAYARNDGVCVWIAKHGIWTLRSTVWQSGPGWYIVAGASDRFITSGEAASVDDGREQAETWLRNKGCL